MLADMKQQDSSPYEYCKTMAQRNELHHAYLFIAPVDKEIEACLKAMADSFLRVTRIDCEPEEESSSISILQIRELIISLSRANHTGQVTFVVMKQSTLMTREAGNALLKILEEPPQGVYFILCAKSIRDMLPTIVSRCYLVRFPIQMQSLSDQQNVENIQALLRADFPVQISLAEKVSVDDFATCEYLLSHLIRSGSDSNSFRSVVKHYDGLQLAYRANRSHVSPQGCVDLLYI